MKSGSKVCRWFFYALVVFSLLLPLQNAGFDRSHAAAIDPRPIDGHGTEILSPETNQSNFTPDPLPIERIRAQTFFTAVPLAFALLHLLLFVFFPRAKENLYYAAFVIFLSGQTYMNFAPESIVNTAILRILSFAMFVFGLQFVYSSIYEKIPKKFFLFVGSFSGLALWILFDPEFSVSPVNFVLMIAAILEFVRTIGAGLKKKISGIWIIAAGALVAALVGFYESFMDIFGFPMIMGIENPGVYGTTVFVISMSAYLAWKFASTNTALERRSEELDVLNTELENRVAQRTRELANANDSLENKNIELTNSRNELLLANDELRQTQIRLVQSEKMASLGALAAGIAHEINTPVGAVSSASDTTRRSIERIIKTIDENGIIEEIKKKSEFKKSLDILKSNTDVIILASERITKIVRSLRNFARLDEAEFQDADIHEGINSTLTLLHHKIKDRIKVVKQFGDIPKIQCSPSQINQVFMNLMNNAVQAIQSKGVISIKTSVEKDKVAIRISDNGEGIKKEHLANIFDPGFTTRGVGIGTGLGLSISYSIIKDHNGDIIVDSEEGRGTEFTVLLPIKQEENPT